MTDAEQVRQAAREVLSRAAYDDLRPSAGSQLAGRVRSWLAQLLAELFDSVGATAIGSVLVVVVPALLVVLAVVVLLRSRGGGSVPAVAADEAGLDRAALLARGEAARVAGDLATAVRVEYAVVVLDLQLREVLDGAPGTTVGDVDRAVRRDLPAVAPTVVAAGEVLADVVYGAVAATEDDLAVVRSAGMAVAPTRAVAT